jgi:hypothetical protein
MVFQQPPYAIVEIRPFFVGRESQDDIAVGHPTFLFPSNKVGDEDRGAILDILRTAAVEIASADA